LSADSSSFTFVWFLKNRPFDKKKLKNIILFFMAATIAAIDWVETKEEKYVDRGASRDSREITSDALASVFPLGVIHTVLLPYLLPLPWINEVATAPRAQYAKHTDGFQLYRYWGDNPCGTLLSAGHTGAICMRSLTEWNDRAYILNALRNAIPRWRVTKYPGPDWEARFAGTAPYYHKALQELPRLPWV
jgi:hypothetical protein